MCSELIKWHALIEMVNLIFQLEIDVVHLQAINENQQQQNNWIELQLL